MQKNAANPHGCSRKVKCGFFFGPKNNLNEASITKIFALTFQRIYFINRKTELKELLEWKLEFKAFYMCDAHIKWKVDAEATQDNSKWQRLYSVNQFHYACKQSSLNKCTNLQILICSMHQQHNDWQYDYATKTRAHLYPTTMTR